MCLYEGDWSLIVYKRPVLLTEMQVFYVESFAIIVNAPILLFIG